jgi:CCR4-NOT transcription complex subunit 4
MSGEKCARVRLSDRAREALDRREEAARAIAAVDGSPSPGGGGEIMRASYGTTKYCMNFLRGVQCTNTSCLDLHEWGDDRDCFTKEDLATL